MVRASDDMVGDWVMVMAMWMMMVVDHHKKEQRLVIHLFKFLLLFFASRSCLLLVARESPQHIPQHTSYKEIG